ncbi:adenylate/guanylate cyclase domain-containing protein [Actinomycetospora endophytica]|uniref:Adenylate/guanylate cyclase domain-containing protein n=1 Tax=Actinomycetospora endophytica TaxID=2291215 RepID=A0ABS8PA06_9PSEU|nr:adenylate/guanylate cyclase domain-containing protein [Actinomycetospora endophytica]MCD2193824.1 adenylate/guanylate cyclase domain-containing protein [Actinomycetospora endophytica]
MTAGTSRNATGPATAGPPSRVAEDREVEAPRDVAFRTKAVVGALIVVANVVGAGILVGLAGWVLPFRALVADEAEALRVNLILFGVYAPLGALVAFGFGWTWMRIPDPPGPGATAADRDRHRRRARRVVLRAPLRLAVVQAVPWVIGVVLFAAVDTRWSVALAVAVAGMIALGGVTTVTVAYRLTELGLRREVARVFVLEPPSGSGMPGVAVRSLGTWVLGTGVPLLGLVIAAGTSLVYGDYFDVTRLGTVTLVLALMALATGFLVTALTSTSLAASVLAVRRALRRVEKGDLDVTVEVSDTTELGLLQSGFNTMVTGLRERDRVRELFGQQVGEDVAAAAMAGQVELGGEVREVAVLFVDLVGSTRMAATRPPTEVMARLNRFFAEVVDVVESHGGWINKFEGDAALALFGAPTDHDDPATAALAAARALADRLDAEHIAIRAGIGASAGEAVAGNIGDTRRYEYTVIGDPVNEASRLCDLAKARPELVAASGAALGRAAESEVGEWTVVGTERLRGREADTEIAVPRSRVDDAESISAETARSEVTRG